MKELINFKKEINFNNNIAEISSISLEATYEETDKSVKGYFLIEGSYRSHELSLNKENFNYKIPFSYDLGIEFVENSVNVNIKDFTYEINADVLSINIDYEVSADEVVNESEFLEQQEFDRFLQSHEVDIVNLQEDEKKEEEIDSIKEIKIDEEVTTDNEKLEERELQQTVIESVSKKEDNYITYHVYVCEEDDTLDLIANKFSISKDELKDYNDIDNVTYGMKIIIPFKDE